MVTDLILLAPWADCAIQGQSIADTLNVPDATKVNFASADKETCSHTCNEDAQCAYWTYNIASKRCSFKTDTQDPLVDDDNVWMGSSDCYGIGE